MPLSFLPQQSRFRWRLIVAIFCMSMGVMIIVGEWWYAQRFEHMILPGVHIGIINVGGKTKEEAQALLDQSVDTMMRAGFPFAYQSKRVTISSILSAREDPDITYELVRWDGEAMLRDAERIGHEGPWWKRWYAQTHALVIGEHINGNAVLEKERLKSALKENFSALEEPAKNAELMIGTKTVTITPESLGKVFDYDAAMRTLEKSLTELFIQPITLSVITDYPSVKKEMMEAMRPEIETLLALGPIQFIQGNRWWRIHPEVWNTWLTVTMADGAPHITLDQTKVITALAPIAEEINRPARDAKFVLQNGRVEEFQTAQEGKRLSAEKTIDRIMRNVLQTHTTTVALAIDTLRPVLTDEAAGNVGVVDLIGVGKSNFKGSPVNRRHNIAVGAKALNGILIAAGEEFSLLKTLGDIDEKSGYKPELVIKGNKTIPEFGGGLCQIGTTTFRAALASGLPITERQNHSYSVPYYLENGKPGVDATIYGPKPDFKFINDTGTPILIQTKIKGDDITFEFWGKKDGRVANRTEPKVTNIRKPPPTKIIETEDLAVGVKKCTERAHTGATAEFTYTVTMPNGEKREKVFRSVYRPWQEVCLVGKEKSAVPAPDAPPAPVPASALPSADTAGVKGE